MLFAMFTEAEARRFAQHWIESWNSGDLEQILEHYDDEVVLRSPMAAKILSDPGGTVLGKAALREYFARGLAAYPQLSFGLLDVLTGISSMVLYYSNQNGSKTAEFMEFNEHQKVIQVVANYST